MYELKAIEVFFHRPSTVSIYRGRIEGEKNGKKEIKNWIELLESQKIKKGKNMSMSNA
jgi:hypothetical protein